uniref:Uncharacterized protein n=1 Tax=Mustela putorius furo TaxID=9669 RepID=M3YPM3_MUSPF
MGPAGVRMELHTGTWKQRCEQGRLQDHAIPKSPLPLLPQGYPGILFFPPPNPGFPQDASGPGTAGQACWHGPQGGCDTARDLERAVASSPAGFRTGTLWRGEAPRATVGVSKESHTGPAEGETQRRRRRDTPAEARYPKGPKSRAEAVTVLQTTASLVWRSGSQSQKCSRQQARRPQARPLPGCAGALDPKHSRLFTPLPGPAYAQPRITAAPALLGIQPDSGPQKAPEMLPTPADHVCLRAQGHTHPVCGDGGGGVGVLEDLLARPGTWTPKTSSSLAAPRPGPPDGSAQGCLGAPCRGGGSRSQQRQARPSEFRAQKRSVLLCALPSRPLYLLPRTPGPKATGRREGARRRAHTHAHTRTHRAGEPGALGGKSPQVPAHSVNPEGGRGPKRAPHPHAGPSSPAPPDSGRRKGVSPGLDWGAKGRPPLDPTGPEPCPLSGLPGEDSARSGPETGVGEGGRAPGRTQRRVTRSPPRRRAAGGGRGRRRKERSSSLLWGPPGIHRGWSQSLPRKRPRTYDLAGPTSPPLSRPTSRRSSAMSPGREPAEVPGLPLGQRSQGEGRTQQQCPQPSQVFGAC